MKSSNYPSGTIMIQLKAQADPMMNVPVTFVDLQRYHLPPEGSTSNRISSYRPALVLDSVLVVAAAAVAEAVLVHSLRICYQTHFQVSIHKSAAYCSFDLAAFYYR